MIELNKEKEPTEQDVQQFVDSVYNYAAHLLFDEDKSDSEVMIDLVSNGINKDDARLVVNNLKSNYAQEMSKATSKAILYGLLWAGGGIALTALTMAADVGIGVVFYGAVIYGGILFFKGLYYLLKSIAIKSTH